MKGRKIGSNGPFREIKGFEFDNVIIKAEDIELEESQQAQPRNEDEYYRHLYHQIASSIYVNFIKDNKESCKSVVESCELAKELITVFKNEQR